MRAAADYLEKISLNRANLEHIALTEKINGSLLVSLKEIINQARKESAIEFKKWCDEEGGVSDYALGRTLTDDELYNFYANNIFPEK